MPASAACPAGLREQRGGPRTGTCWRLAALRASQSCSAGSGSLYRALGCTFSCHHSQMDGTEEGGICLQVVQGRRKAQALGCRDCVLTTDPHTAQSRNLGKDNFRGGLAGSRLSPPCSDEQGLAQCKRGPCKAALSPGNFSSAALVARDAAKPSSEPWTLLRLGCPVLTGARQPLPWGKSSSLHHPLLPSPLLSLSLPKARPLGLPERGRPERLDFPPGITRTR